MVICKVDKFDPTHEEACDRSSSLENLFHKGIVLWKKLSEWNFLFTKGIQKK